MMDVTLAVPQWPKRGGDVLANTRHLAAGGGFNVMSSAARHGMDVVYGGQLGQGPFADLAHASLISEGIIELLARTSSQDLGLCMVIVDVDGERTFITSPGAELELTVDQLTALDIVAGDYVYLSGYNVVYPELELTLLAWLEVIDPDVIVVFDPGPRVLDIPESTLRAVLGRTDWLLCNTIEGLALTQVATIDEVPDALLAQTGVRGVVVHDGAAGCLVVTKDQPVTRVAAFHATVVDTNGAGDTHNGVLLAELANGRDVLYAARRANAAAAMVVSRYGAATCPARSEISAWYELLD